jgi:hypothetical protein
MNVVYWVRGVEFADMAAISAATVKKVYPKARVFAYTDDAHEALRGDVFDDALIIPAFNMMPAMLANLCVQCHFCLNDGFTAPTAFLDADVLAVKPIVLPAEPWDLIVTQRDHVGRDEDGNKVVGVAAEMPYNYGVMLVNNTYGGREAIIALRDRVSRMGQARQDWYGNQWALRELVGGAATDPTPRRIDKHLIFWCINVEVRDCDTWNYTPESADEDVKDKYFVHVKGDRKDMFDLIAQRLLNDN